MLHTRSLMQHKHRSQALLQYQPHVDADHALSLLKSIQGFYVKLHDLGEICDQLR